ncbi:MAG: hypothetical protein ACREB9_03985, partial [Thermoplasmata archaeon]
VVSGYVCAAVSTPATSTTGCGTRLPVSGVPVFLSVWSPALAVTWDPDPAGLPHVATATSSSDGGFSMTTSLNGTLVVWAANSTVYGGGFVEFDLSAGGSFSTEITIYPYVAQDNTTLVLPAWNSLSSYADNGNCAGCNGASSSGTGSQTPLLSWTADGAFYVNATDELVFYSFADRTVTDLAAWTPLYDNYMFYHGIENTEYITTDGSWVYEMGCLSRCGGSSIATVLAVNVSTGRLFEYNFSTGVLHLSSGGQNGQVNMIGMNGNSSIIAVSLANGDAGTVYAWDLWTGAEWTLGTLPYFEANNDEWVPQLNSFFTIEAQGETGDGVAQLELFGSSDASYHLTAVAQLSYWTGHTAVNGANWGGYNVQTHEIAFLSTLSGTMWDSVVIALTWSATNNTYELSSLVSSLVYDGNLATPAMEIDSSSQRSTPYVSGYLSQEYATSMLYNNTLYADPFDGMYLNTNVSVGVTTFRTTSGSMGYVSGMAGNVFPEGLFYNASYEISIYSVDCRSDSCPINGPTPGSVDWIWNASAPEFPFPTATPLAQPEGPGAAIAVNLSVSGGSVTLRWDPPTTGVDPLLNYTVFYGGGPGYGLSVSLLPTATSVTIPWAGAFYYELVASNFHGYGTPVTGNSTLGLTYHTVTFTETGLPSGTNWSVSLDGFRQTSSASSIPFGEPNGTYTFSVSAAGWGASPQHGDLTVSGSAVDQGIAFSQATYVLTFGETGLPSGSRWSVTLAGVASSSMTSAITFHEPNGTYAYSVSASGWGASPQHGDLSVSGSAVDQGIAFSPATYVLTFGETGLPSGTRWSVTLAGVASASTTSAITFREPNGTYAYSVSAPGWVASSESGQL